MPLTTQQRQRYARQLLLPAWTSQVQAKLCQKHYCVEGDNAELCAQSERFLQAAGATITNTADTQTTVIHTPTRSSIDKLAKVAWLEHAATALSAAWTAHRALMNTAQLGDEGSQADLDDLCLMP